MAWCLHRKDAADDVAKNKVLKGPSSDVKMMALSVLCRCNGRLNAGTWRGVGLFASRFCRSTLWDSRAHTYQPDKTSKL